VTRKMTGKMSRRLVIDASVARSAGETEDPVSKRCREFLLAALTICHKLVVTRELEKEWNKHQSGFFISWRVAMTSADKEDDRGSLHDEKFRKKIEKLGLSESEEAAALKDAHLIEAARDTDCAVASRDDTVRKIYKRASDRVREVKPIAWVNPVKNSESPLEWLKSGARNDPERTLGKKKKH